MCNIKTWRKQENGIQVIKEHRDIVQADSPVQHGVPRLVCRGDGVERVEFLPLCGVSVPRETGEPKGVEREKIYVLDNGKSLMLALSQDLSQN